MKDDPNGDYAPRSPDLSAYDSDTVTAFDQKYRGSISHPTPQPQPHITSQPQTQPQPQPQPLPLPPPPPPPPHTPHHAQPYHPPPFANTPGTVPMPSRFGKMKLEAEDHDWIPQNQPHDDMMEDHQPQQQQQQPQPPSNGLKPHPELAPGVAEGIEVRTKFPAARIKRIMQADEDVGKVAQVTPHVVAKALELFMISLVTKAANEAKSRSSKRVTAVHLKQAVLKEEHFDFLNEIVNKVSDAPATANASATAAPDARAGSPDDAAAATAAAAAAPPTETKRRKSSRKKRKDSDDL
ncbi:DNA polymerase epsilon subunit C [Phyllosticta citricarpa]|uniref:DNA polymerase epsilon subunit C n=1 Tax=Phyllosticta citricarpa TaxID=55181 RepID=A0ABR1MFL6_9PEZI